MLTLGLNAAFHDSAAVSVKEGVLLAAAEEKRSTRIKHAKRRVPFTACELPFHAIDWCQKQPGATLADVDHVAYSFDPAQFTKNHEELHFLERFTIEFPLCPGQEKTTTQAQWNNPWDPLFLIYIVNASEQLRDGVYQSLGEAEVAHSFGLLYEQITTHLSFLHSSDEYKVMALAAMGEPLWASQLSEQVRLLGDGQFEILPIDMTRLSGPPREPDSATLQQHFELAASVQKVLESKVLELTQWLRQASGERNLAMAGGVALNCMMNSKLRDQGPFDSVWAQPAAGDASTALGAAFWTDARMRQGNSANNASSNRVELTPSAWTQQHAYWGPFGEDDEIAEVLQWAGLAFEDCVDSQRLVERTATLLERNAIVGWFQGCTEWGLRALGSRSILASPVDPEMQTRLNKFKDREDFRPAAPAVTIAAFYEWFSPSISEVGTSPFMLFTHQVLPRQVQRIPLACHTDGSARVPTVQAQSHPRFHALLQTMGQRTGVPVLVNTSFNVRGQPVVCSPKDALEAFFIPPLDSLVIGRFILTKPGFETVENRV